jgi:hypothetical protein
MLNMPFALETPLAILGLLSLLIPLGIHLLSKARPRTLAFAHIAFIKIKTSPKLRQLRLTQLVLLALRLIMFLLATLILAQVYWQNSNHQVNSHVLVTEDWLNHATEEEKQALTHQVNDSNLVLLSTKNRNINKMELAQWPTNNQQIPTLNIWSKVADYLAEQSADSTISVYTTNSLKQFIGKQIPLPKHVKWHVKEISVEDITKPYTANIKVLYNDSSSTLLVYLRAAFEAINTHNNLNINVNYISYEVSNNKSKHLLLDDVIINLSEQPFEQSVRPFDPQWQSPFITQAELNDVKQANFVLTLAQLLFSSQSQVWWLQNTRLSTSQIIQSSSNNAVQRTAAYKKSSSNMADSTSLHIWLVSILVSVFILERLLSEWPNSRVKTELDE